MLREDREHIQADLTNIVEPNGNIKAIMVLSNAQNIYASSDESLIGQSVDWPLVVRALESGNPQYGDYGSDMEQVAVVLPIPNEPECRTCHGLRLSVLGVLKIHLDEAPLNTQLAQQMQIMSIIGAAIFIVIGLVINYGARRVIIDPMSKLVAKTELERNRQLQLYATDRLASIGELSASIAHEINNPLTSIVGFSDLILQKSNDLPPEIKEELKIINSEAVRTAEIVKGLLTFARKHPKKQESVNVNSLIVNVLKMREYEQKVSNIVTKAILAFDLPAVQGDPSQLQQAFLNIIINAEYFMTTAHGKGNLTVTTKFISDRIHISIADDGPGIPKENLRRIFDPFFTTKEVGKGTGLGLSIVHGIVTEHGGTVTVNSELGKGATFTIELPVTNENNDSGT